jgi:hypothetical protein
MYMCKLRCRGRARTLLDEGDREFLREIQWSLCFYICQGKPTWPHIGQSISVIDIYGTLEIAGEVVQEYAWLQDRNAVLSKQIVIICLIYNLCSMCNCPQVSNVLPPAPMWCGETSRHCALDVKNAYSPAHGIAWHSLDVQNPN